MAALMKSWSWPTPSEKGRRMNALENFYMQLYKHSDKLKNDPWWGSQVYLCFKLLMTSCYDMFVSIKTLTVLDFMEFLNHITYRASTNILTSSHIINNFWVFDASTQTRELRFRVCIFLSTSSHCIQVIYSGIAIYRFWRGRRKQTMNAEKRSIQIRGAFKF